MWDHIWINGQFATMNPAIDQPYGTIKNGAIAIKDGKIAWIGAMVDLAGEPATLADKVSDLAGAWVTPGLVDCHTHLVYGGNRADEFEKRLNGVSYEEIARAGGGIRSSVTATRAASEDELVTKAQKRLGNLLREGVTTIEIKSGYGLRTEDEAKMLRAARRLGRENDLDVVTTFLGAHALPPEFANDADGYIDLVCNDMLPAIAAEGLADAVDAFCENIAFNTAQTRRVFDAARKLNLPVKLHAEQLSDQKGSILAADYSALSTDHLEYLGEDGVVAMAKAGVTAVLLPGAFYCLRETKLPPIDLLRQHGVTIAIATDSNPGTSPALSLLLMANMACTLFRMTPEEALAGITRNGARALGRGDSHGTLEAGKVADFVVWDIDSPAELSYAIGGNPCQLVVRRGRERALAA
nr:imidazolonepropionase [Thalassospira marina]